MSRTPKKVLGVEGDREESHTGFDWLKVGGRLERSQAQNPTSGLDRSCSLGTTLRLLWSSMTSSPRGSSCLF